MDSPPLRLMVKASSLVHLFVEGFLNKGTRLWPCKSAGGVSPANSATVGYRSTNSVICRVA